MISSTSNPGREVFRRKGGVGRPAENLGRRLLPLAALALGCGDPVEDLPPGLSAR